MLLGPMSQRFWGQGLSMLRHGWGGWGGWALKAWRRLEVGLRPWRLRSCCPVVRRVIEPPLVNGSLPGLGVLSRRTTPPSHGVEGVGRAWSGLGCCDLVGAILLALRTPGRVFKHRVPESLLTPEACAGLLPTDLQGGCLRRREPETPGHCYVQRSVLWVLGPSTCGCCQMPH